MLKSILGICSGAAVIGAALIPTAASAAVTAPASDGPTTVTFSVGNGELTLTAPDTVDLSQGLPGDPPFGGNIGDTTVTDNRAALAATWTVTVSETDFVTGGGSPAETIPANAVTYDPTIEVSTGNFTSLAANFVTLDTGAQRDARLAHAAGAARRCCSPGSVWTSSAVTRRAERIT